MVVARMAAGILPGRLVQYKSIHPAVQRVAERKPLAAMRMFINRVNWLIRRLLHSVKVRFITLCIPITPQLVVAAAAGMAVVLKIIRAVVAAPASSGLPLHSQPSRICRVTS